MIATKKISNVIFSKKIRCNPILVSSYSYVKICYSKKHNKLGLSFKTGRLHHTLHYIKMANKLRSISKDGN